MSSTPGADSLREYGRGLAGGLLFSLPLLYTMEVWWSGFIAGPVKLLALLGFTFVLLLGYNRYSGMRRDASWVEVGIDSIEELGIGVGVSAGILYLIGRIGPGVPFEESLGKTVVEAAIVAIGFSVGTAQLGGAGGRRDAGKSGRGGGEEDDRSGLSSQLAISTCGAVLFASNVAPTEEVVMIAVETGPWRLVGIAALSIVLGSLILYYIDFTGAGSVTEVGGTLDIVLGSAITYAVALVSSALILWFFGRFDGLSLAESVRHTVVLGLPASIGASAGRLLLQL